MVGWGSVANEICGAADAACLGMAQKSRRKHALRNHSQKHASRHRHKTQGNSRENHGCQHIKCLKLKGGM